jgi:hypothetical protein
MKRLLFLLLICALLLNACATSTPQPPTPAPVRIPTITKTITVTEPAKPAPTVTVTAPTRTITVTAETPPSPPVTATIPKPTTSIPSNLPSLFDYRADLSDLYYVHVNTWTYSNDRDAENDGISICVDLHGSNGKNFYYEGSPVEFSIDLLWDPGLGSFYNKKVSVGKIDFMGEILKIPFENIDEGPIDYMGSLRVEVTMTVPGQGEFEAAALSLWPKPRWLR